MMKTDTEKNPEKKRCVPDLAEADIDRTADPDGRRGMYGTFFCTGEFFLFRVVQRDPADLDLCWAHLEKIVSLRFDLGICMALLRHIFFAGDQWVHPLCFCAGAGAFQCRMGGNDPVPFQKSALPGRDPQQ